MKRYIKSSADIPISELFDRIGKIVLVDDVSEINIVESAELLDEGCYISCSSSSILSLSSFDVDHIYSVEALQRVYDVAPDKLSKYQTKFLASIFSRKRGYTDADMTIILDKLKDCTQIDRSNIANDTKRFFRQYSISDSAILDLIHSLTPSDMQYWTQSVSPNSTFADTLIVAYPDFEFTDQITGKQAQMLMYLKIDYSITNRDGDAVALISFHKNTETKLKDELEYKKKYGDYKSTPIPDKPAKK